MAAGSSQWNRRRAMCALLGTSASAVLPALAQPAWRPQRPLELMVGAAPGGSIDLTARLIQRTFDERKLTGTQTIVVNRPGAGQGLAWAHMIERAKSVPTLGMGGPNLVSNPVTGLHPIDHADVTTVAVLFDDYMAIAVRADSPIRSMREAIERLRKDPGALSIGVAPSIGSGAHTGGVVALRAGGVDVKNARFVVYKAAGEAIVAVMSGDLDMVVGTVANFPPHMQSGRIRLIAVTSPARLGGSMAQVPTLREQGIDGVYTNWRSVIGPKPMPREQIVFWEEALAAVVKSEEWQRDLERNFWTANFLVGDAAQRYVEEQARQFRDIYSVLAPGK
jgi:putative tricarboxylic transport membrane protein